MEHAVRNAMPPPELRVLLVDDDPFQLKLMAELLGSIGITSVQVARSGLEGLEVYRKSMPPPQVIVVDLCMPQLDGMGFLRQLSMERCQAAIVIVSGHNRTPPDDPNWNLIHYDGPVLHLAEKFAHLQGLRVRGTFEKPITLDKVVAMMQLAGHPVAAHTG